MVLKITLGVKVLCVVNKCLQNGEMHKHDSRLIDPLNGNSYIAGISIFFIFNQNSLCVKVLNHVLYSAHHQGYIPLTQYTCRELNTSSNVSRRILKGWY